MLVILNILGWKNWETTFGFWVCVINDEFMEGGKTEV